MSMRKLKIWFLPISLFLLFSVCYFLTKPVFKDGDYIKITTTVYSDPQNFGSKQYLKIDGLKIYTSVIDEINYGDRIVVEGVVRKDVLTDAKILKINKNVGPFSFYRNRITDFFQRVLPQPESGLLSGILLGDKGNISKDFYEKTKITGVAHVVVASGTNVTFVVSFLISFLSLYLSRRKLIPFVLLGIILYLFISGFEAPLVRAAIMSSALFVSQETGRLVSVWRIFAISALIMLVYNPVWIEDVGFLLSFASTGGLLLFERRIEYALRKIPSLIRQDFSTSLAAQIGVAPILFVTFGYFNMLSPFINALVLWTVPLLMVIGSIGAAACLFWEPLGKVIVYLAYPLLYWFTKVVEYFAGIS